MTCWPKRNSFRWPQHQRLLYRVTRSFPNASRMDPNRNKPRREFLFVSFVKIPQKPGDFDLGAFASAMASGNDRANPSISAGSTAAKILVRIMTLRIPQIASGVLV